MRSLFLVFFSAYLVRASITSFSFDFLIREVGREHLSFYISLSALCCISFTLLLTFIGNRLQPIWRLVGLHGLFLLAGVVGYFSAPALSSKIVFVTLNGLWLVAYVTNWTVASSLVSPFESRRIYPSLLATAQIGIFTGSIIAIASGSLFPKSLFLPVWILTEAAIVIFGLSLTTKKTNRDFNRVFTRRPNSPSLFHLFKNYSFVPKVTLWIFLWGLLFSSVSTLVGNDLAQSSHNITAIYGILTLAAAGLNFVISKFFFKRLVQKLKLSTLLFAISGVAAVMLMSYLAFPSLGVALGLYLIFRLFDSGFVGLTFSLQFNLYSQNLRDRLRLLSEILTYSLGAASVGLIFSLDSSGVSWTLFGICTLILSIALFSSRAFNREVATFLKSRNQEDRYNAASLFENLEDQVTYQRVLRILSSSKEDIDLRINILNTFNNLRTTKPIHHVLKILEESKELPLRIAIIRYLDGVDFHSLDPFRQHRVLEVMKSIVQKDVSLILRSMAIKVYIQNGPHETTVEFVMKGLSDSDERVVANTIESMGHLSYPGIVDLLQPYLSNPVPRVRANATVILWSYPEARAEAEATLTRMVYSGDEKMVSSGIYVMGVVKDSGNIQIIQEFLKNSSDSPSLRRNCLISLLKLRDTQHIEEVVDLILDPDEKQGVNTAYLAMQIEETILNEHIVRKICERGPKAQELAAHRFARTGIYCKYQLDLLRGQTPKLAA